MKPKNLLIVGNWKMNKTTAETKDFLTKFSQLYEENKSKILETTRFGIAVPAIVINELYKNKVANNMVVAAQNAYFEAKGPYTGEISLAMIKSVGANSVIIGHAERRQIFGETNEFVNKKVLAALENKLLPIVCVGETLEQRKSSHWKEHIKSQLQSLYKDVKKEDFTKIVIAYEPIWAIGTGVSISTEEAQKACEYTRGVISNLTSREIASKVIIQYGGSVKPNNIYDLVSQPDIDGALVGGASLDPEMFIRLLTLNS